MEDTETKTSFLVNDMSISCICVKSALFASAFYYLLSIWYPVDSRTYELFSRLLRMIYKSYY